MQVNDQKCVRSWTVTPSTVFTHRAVQHPVSRRLYVVENGKLLRSWEPALDKIENGQSKSVCQIWAVSTCAIRPWCGVPLNQHGSECPMQRSTETASWRCTRTPISTAPCSCLLTAAWSRQTPRWPQVDPSAPPQPTCMPCGLVCSWLGFGQDLNHARCVISSSGTAPVYSGLGSTGRDRDLYLFAVYADKDRAGQYAAQVYEIDTHTAALATRPKAQHALVCARPAPCFCGCRCSCCILWSTRGTAAQI
jgi:hypothetical protein